jgi:photosystem II stability/assembly factor-like uncharacterized protein
VTLPTSQRARARRRRAIILPFFAVLLAGCVIVARPAPAVAEAGGRLVAEPMLSATAAGVRLLFGASPREAPGAIWGASDSNQRIHMVRYTEAGEWETLPDPVDEAGNPVALPDLGFPLTASAGRTTPAGGVVTVAALSTQGEKPPEALIVRDPGGIFHAVVPPEPAFGEEPVLGEKEQLFLNSGASPRVTLAAIEEPGGKTGAFVAPYPGPGLLTGIVHYDGAEWSREPICVGTEAECATVPVPTKALPGTIFGIEGTGPGNAWLLTRKTSGGSQAEGIVLAHREKGMWLKQELGGALGAIFRKEKPEFASLKKGAVTIVAREPGQPLTVTSSGVWVDANVTVGTTQVQATIYYDIASGEVTGSWCDPPESASEPEALAWQAICEFPLGSELPAGEGRSFAWSGPGGFGTRVITGVGKGAMLLFENGAFSRIPLIGNGGSSAGAALAFPEREGGEARGLEGWLGPSYKLTRQPVPSGLQPWSVPFRHPLLAIAPQPGAAIGAISSKALAVGAEGEVARYLPGVGWQPETLLNGQGKAVTPNLRGVAWPTTNFAYAVGDEGAMWLWRASTGLWEPDPGAPPNLIRGNFTGIAFDPNEPERGYAVGKQGLLLGYGKRWTQEAIPAGLSPEINITSIAFAGDEALATWMLAVPAEGGARSKYIGGLIVNDGSGSGWRIEETASTALAETEKTPEGFAARQVAALPDGGAVIVGRAGGVIEREAAGAPWHVLPGPPVGYPTAVAAIREGGQLRALISVGDPGFEKASDEAQAINQPPAGGAPLLTEPYPLPRGGFLIRQTARGWHDEERQAFPEPVGGGDLPRQPDPILAIGVNSEGTQGWVVGGQTGQSPYVNPENQSLTSTLQTAGVYRYGPAAAPPANSASVPITVSGGEATFAIGGGAQCASLCADLEGTGIGPDVWLRTAVARAASIPGLRAFLYTGGSVAAGVGTSATVAPSTFADEEGAYASRLGANAGILPVFTAPSESDRYRSSLRIFGEQFAGFARPLGVASGIGIAPVSEGNRAEGDYSYAFDSEGAGGSNPVRVIVLDDSISPLPGQNLCWLGEQLALAKGAGRPAIVLGNREVGTQEELKQVLVTGASAACPQAEPGGASAYFYKVEGNFKSSLTWGAASIPAFGTGSLGYLGLPFPSRQEAVPASGFLLASVKVAARSAATNVAPVTVRLVPSIGSLALNTVDGTLLRRSHTALFEALARRPIAGSGCPADGGCTLGLPGPDPYVQIPARCVAGHGYRGAPCGAEIPPEYRFTSSRPDIANFVEVDPTSTNPRAVFLNGAGKPVADPTSALLCAFNSGTTVVTVETGGLAYSVPVVVQEGSVQRPCGTVPRTDLPAEKTPLESPPLPLEPEPKLTSGPSAIPPPPAPTTTPVTPQTPVHIPSPVPHNAPPKPVPSPLHLPFFQANPMILPVPVIVPPPPAPSVEPTPPSGTSPVTQPAVSPEPEEEEEAAFDLVHHAVAYLPGDRTPAALRVGSGLRAEGHGHRFPSVLLPALLLFAAVAFTGIAKPRLRRSPEPAFHRNRPQRRPFDEQP